MASSPFKTKSFHLTSLDREMFDPERGGFNVISWWYRAYFDGEFYPWQHYFYHHPAKDKLVVSGTRSGKRRDTPDRMPERTSRDVLHAGSR